MSRVVSPSTSQPTGGVQVPHDKIAMRAYEKWVKKGRPHGSHEQDWIEAENELKAEFARGGSTGSLFGSAGTTQRR